MSTEDAPSVCPHLGLYYDSEIHREFATTQNYCHVEDPPLAIGPAYQVSTCLGTGWENCPRYRAAAGEDIALEELDPGYYHLAHGSIEDMAPPASLGTIDRDSLLEERDTPLEVEEEPTRRLSGCLLVSIAVPALLVLIVGLFLLGQAVSSSDPTPTGPGMDALQLTATAMMNARPDRIETPTLPPTLTPWPTSTETSTPTPSPTATPTATPTDTATPTPEPTATPTATRRPGTRPSPAPTREPTKPAIQYPAPTLLSPANEQVFESGDEIVLRWQAVGQLGAQAYYVVTVAYSHNGETWYDDKPWIKNTSWLLSSRDYLPALSDDGGFRWSIQVMHQTGIDSEGKPTGTTLSPRSVVRTLTWKRAPGGGDGDDGGGNGGIPPIIPP